MSLHKSVNNFNASLPKLLGKRSTTPEKLTNHENGSKNPQIHVESSALQEAKILQKLATEYITENAIRSIDDGDNKVIYRSNIVNTEYAKQ